MIRERKRRCSKDIAYAPGPLRRSGCLPAEPYPPQWHIQLNNDVHIRQEPKRIIQAGYDERPRMGFGNPGTFEADGSTH